MFIPAIAGVPVLWWSEPGCGKSQIIEDAFRAAGRYCHTEVLSISDPCDIGGLLVKHEDRAIRLLPDWFLKLKEESNGCLFLDELTTCPQMNQAAALRLVRSRAINGESLPDTVVIMAAANPPESAANGCYLSAPMANRFCHLEWKPGYEKWINGMVGGFQPTGLPVLSEDWKTKHLGAARGAVSGFIRVQPGLLHAMPDSEVARSKAWPSPRTWEYVSIVMAACADLKVSADEYVAGLVGPGAALAFVEWQKNADLPDPEDVLKDPEKAKIDDKSDVVYAVCASVTAAAILRRSRPRWNACWTYLLRCHEHKNNYGDIVASMLAEIFRLKDKDLPHFKGLEKLRDIVHLAKL